MDDADSNIKYVFEEAQASIESLYKITMDIKKILAKNNQLFQHKKEGFEVQMLTLARNPATNGTLAVYKVTETMDVLVIPLSQFNRLFQYKIGV